MVGYPSYSLASCYFYLSTKNAKYLYFYSSTHVQYFVQHWQFLDTQFVQEEHDVLNSSKICMNKLLTVQNSCTNTATTQSVMLWDSVEMKLCYLTRTESLLLFVLSTANKEIAAGLCLVLMASIHQKENVYYRVVMYHETRFIHIASKRTENLQKSLQKYLSWPAVSHSCR